MRRSPSSQTSAHSDIDDMQSTTRDERPSIPKSYSSSDIRMSISPESNLASTLVSNFQQGNFKQNYDLSLSQRKPKSAESMNKQTGIQVYTSKPRGNKMALSNLISDPEPVEQPHMCGFSSEMIKPKSLIPYYENSNFETNKGDPLFPHGRESQFRMQSVYSLPSNRMHKSGAGPSLLNYLAKSHKQNPSNFGNQGPSLPGLTSRYLEIGSMGRQRLETPRLPIGSVSQGIFSIEHVGKADLRKGSKEKESEFDNIQVTSLKAHYQPVPNEPKAKRPWTEQEDSLLRSLVDQLGQGLWAAIAAQIPGRSGKQVRERWLNHLSPNVTKRPWSIEEDEIIIESHRQFGNCWSRIAKLLEGRSDNSVKNRFYTTLRRRITTPRPVNKRGIPPCAQASIPSKKKRKSPTVQQPSEQVEIVNRRCKQARVWE